MTEVGKMTREEAIQILRTRIVPTMNWQEIHEAVDMAIEALERYNSEGCWENREHVQVDEGGYDVATCSFCGSEITLEYPHDNYCPNCGTLMHGKVDWK